MMNSQISGSAYYHMLNIIGNNKKYPQVKPSKPFKNTHYTGLPGKNVKQTDEGNEHDTRWCKKMLSFKENYPA